MNAKEFFDLVSEMRSKQKEYFRTRSTSVLSESKTLERRVDAEISRVNQIMKEKQEQLLKIDEDTENNSTLCGDRALGQPGDRREGKGLRRRIPRFDKELRKKDIINAVGITKLLDNMDIEAIMAYLNDLGVKTEWEENL